MTTQNEGYSALRRRAKIPPASDSETLGEVDSSHQFARTEVSPKITGIAGDVIEQSVFMSTCAKNSQNSFPIFLIRKTNHTASLLHGQTFSFLNHRQTNVLTSGYHHKVINYTPVRYQGHSSTLRASALS